MFKCWVFWCRVRLTAILLRLPASSAAMSTNSGFASLASETADPVAPIDSDGILGVKGAGIGGCEYSGLILTNLVRDEFVVVAVIVAVVRH